jgi:hypothetical protein
MAAWLPVIKASLPYVTQIVTAAIPAFTSKPGNTPPDEVVPKQIEELQAAVTHNAEAVKGLATQLKETIEAIDQSAVRLEAELARQRRMTLLAVIIAAVSAAIAITAVVVA